MSAHDLALVAAVCLGIFCGGPVWLAVFLAARRLDAALVERRKRRAHEQWRREQARDLAITEAVIVRPLTDAVPLSLRGRRHWGRA